MSVSSCQTEAVAKEVRQVTLCVAGRRVTYRLTEEAGTFAVTIRKEREVSSVEAGRDFGKAALFFDLVCKGGVTPCTLPFIHEDMVAEGRI